jgi:FG-GAP repeat
VGEAPVGLSARMVLLPDWGLRICAVLLAALTFAVGLSAMRLEPAGIRSTRLHSAASGLLALPVSARGAVSADLGRQDPRYRVHRVSGVGGGATLSAVNAGQHFSERFSPAGVTLSSGQARFLLGLAGIGRGAHVVAPPAAAARATGNRVSYARGRVREWFANGPLGLEQGFDVARKPGGSGVLTLAVSVAGASSVRLRDGSALLSGKGGSLRYSGLSASDARGRVLRAWLGVSGGRLVIRVDDRRARYPVRVDPFVGQGEPFTAGGEVGEGAFGYSVALSADGNTALIGGPGDNGDLGAAWVFTRSGETWSQQGAKLTGGEEQGQGTFGTGVALSGDGNTALIGGEGDNKETGAAWVFTRSGAVWTQQGPKLVAVGGLAGDSFGVSVALSSGGETALVGAPGANSSYGRVYDFARSGSSWTQQGPGFEGEDEVHSTPDGDVDELGPAFGASLALSADGSTLLVGGPFDNEGVGAAWVFVRSGESWMEQGSKLTASYATGKANEGFSAALSADGDTALVGGPKDDGGEGAAWVYSRSGGVWFQGPRLSVPSAGDASIGLSVALSGEGNLAILSGSGESGVWEFKGGGTSWSNVGKVIGGSASLALSSDANTLLVGGAASRNGSGFAGVLVNVPETAPPGPPNPPSTGPPSRHFALGDKKVSENGSIELTVEVPGPGVLNAVQPVSSAIEDRVVKPVAAKSKSTHGPKGQPPVLVAPVTQTVWAYEERATIVLTPTPAALRELAHKQRITLPVQVSFTGTGDQKSAATTDITFTQPGYSFEHGAENWVKAWGDLTAVGTSAHHHTGKHALRITIHSDPYSAIDVARGSGLSSGAPLGLLEPGVTISMWVYRPAGTPPVGFQVIVRVGAEWTECRSAEVRPKVGRWVRLSITVPDSQNCRGSGEANLEVHGIGLEIDDKHAAAKGKSVYLDDVSW